MKMLYIYLGGGLRPTSVQKKIVAKISRFREQGIETDGLFMSYEVQEPTTIQDHITVRPLRRSARRFFTAIDQRKHNALATTNAIDEIAQHYDVLYFRYPGASTHWLPLLSRHGHKMLFEHNSKELEELRLSAQSVLFGLRPSTLIPWLQDKIWTVRNERLVGPKMLRSVSMGLAVTNDMARYEAERAGGEYHCVGNPNGVDVDSVPLRTAPDYDGTVLRMMFMRGANTDAPYHGVDRLLQGLVDYRGETRLTLYLVGRIFDKEKAWLEANEVNAEIRFTGQVGGEDLSALFDECHLSFGSLGLHRIQMWEGSVLKVNESLARGIPLVVAHKDMELSYHEEYAPYYLQCPADESAIDMSAVVRFSENVMSMQDHPQQMRALAKKFTDYEVKITRAAELIKAHFS